MKLSIIVPCYNEETVLPETAKRLLGVLQDLQADKQIDPDSGIYFVDDGSIDQTWGLIERLAQEYGAIHGIKLSRNHGHQNALLAGLLAAPGDAVVSIDADLQDDVEVIKAMVAESRKGHDIVYGVRSQRDTDSFSKRFSAELYYRLLRLMGVDTVFNHADYRLLSRRALEGLRQFGETNLFLRGIIPLLGFPSTRVHYRRTERFAGESKYPLRKMFALAIEGIASFTTLPLRIITLFGLLMCLVSAGLGIWALWTAFFGTHVVPGWASTVVPLYFLGAVQLVSIGVIGEYLGKIYLEVKARPRYIIEKTL